MPRIHRRRPAAAVVVLALAASAGLATAVTSVAGPGATPTGAPVATVAAEGSARGFYDARTDVAVAGGETPRVLPQEPTAAFDARVQVDVDPATGTPRMVSRLDGFLTPASPKPAREVVLDHVSANLAAYGLESRDLSTFEARPTYTDVAGIRHLSWTQAFDGLEVFGHGLRAAVTSDGRLLAVSGSPMPSRLVSSSLGGTVTTADEAIRTARDALGERPRIPGPRDVASERLFVAGGTTYRAWQVITMSGRHPALSVLDARTGSILYLRPLAASARAPENRRAGGSRALAHRFFPGSAKGGEQRPVNLTRRGWLSATATALDGNNTHTWSDVDDDDLPQPTEEVGPVTGQDWSHPLRPVRLGWASFCGDPAPCTWNPHRAFSWRKNRRQSATQAFFFVNTFHDHLLAAPIGFTEAAGNFQAVNASGQGVSGDAVQTHTSDGADSGAGLPDGNHVDRTSMATPPDGQAPTMQLRLQHQPGTSYPAGDPYSPTHSSDQADTVYHEYTHGLSNRLVVDAHGNSTLGGVQAGAMGEGWSDWYAMDYLVARGLQPDRPEVADVRLFVHSGAAADIDRSEPIDCGRTSTSSLCDGGLTGHRGGYSYRDYGRVAGRPEVHADGEIWGQTLWDLRRAVGPAVSRSLVTRAMELAPGNPSFLDMRNAILLADTAVFGAEHRSAIWSVFARRGMGFFAGSLGGDDPRPGADGKVPPTGSRKGVVTGLVRDDTTGQPVPDVRVTLAFQGGPGRVNPSMTTGQDGRYRIGPVPVGTYPKLVVSGPGYDAVHRRVEVLADGTTLDLDVRRNWAAASGGATVSSFTGPDHLPPCGPGGAIDGSGASGWRSSAGDDSGTPGDGFAPKHVTVDLGRPVDVSWFEVDPSATCGDGPSASTGGYRIETSKDGAGWAVAAEGSFAADDRGRLNRVEPARSLEGVRHVRFTVLSNQTPDFAGSCPDDPYSGCASTGLSELVVRGTG